MARYASEAKGGYYPTPPEQMALVCQRLEVGPGIRINLLDPCCGEGLAAQQLADSLRSKGAQVVTYGIELEAGRTDKARRILNHVIAGGYESLRMTNNAVNVMWLNPPYGHTSSGNRMEAVFLRDLSAERMQPGGLLMFCVPQHALKACANILAARFEGLSVYRFNDKFYPLFRQVVVFGYRRAKNTAGPDSRRTLTTLERLSEQGPEALPPLDKNDGRTFAVPDAEKEIKLFRGTEITDTEAVQAVEHSPVFKKIAVLIEPPPMARVKMSTPVLPLKLAHLGTAITAGAVGGNMGTHIVVGSVKKTSKLVNLSKYTDAQIEQMVTSIKVFSPKGIFEL